MSDLHLEFDRGNEWVPKNTNTNEILLLAGDIHLGTKAKDWIINRCAEFKHVIYILGNHEYYHNEYWDVQDFWTKVEGMPDNFTFLHKDAVVIDGVRIVGGTLWTLIDHDDTVANNYGWMYGRKMNDYHIVRYVDKDENRIRALWPMDTRKEHIETVEVFKKILNQPFDGKTVVVTHHLPTEKAVDPAYKGSIMNPFYMTELDWMMKEYNIDVWCHGHTHVNVDTTIHNTRILCNPRGYHGYATNPGFNEDFVFET